MVTVLSIFFGLAFITLVAYIILSFVLDPMPEGELNAENTPTSSDLLNAVDEQLSAGEKRLREMERYVTSDTFTLRSRFSSALRENLHETKLATGRSEGKTRPENRR
ncbi:Phage shock protein C [Enterobacter hormaechei]|nr:Phage shock protein C [Enterobacter hormaechei]